MRTESAAVDGDGRAAPGGRQPTVYHRRRPPLILLLPVALVGIAIAALASQRLTSPAGQVAVCATSTPEPRAQARGQIRAVAQSRIGTIAGGVVASIAVEVGDGVSEQQELARVRGSAGVEVLTAPIRGTVTGIPMHVGDTVLPGATIVTVADLSRLQVETTDVDEFLIARVRPGQRVLLTIDALQEPTSPTLQVSACSQASGARRAVGQVRTVALEPVVTTGGDEHYPVTIDILHNIPDLRAGMTVRVLFPD